MVAKRLLDDAFSLPLTDQIELLERLRDNLLIEADRPEAPESIHRILDSRLAAFEQDEEAGAPWSDVVARLRHRLASK